MKVFCDLEKAPFQDYAFYNMNLDKGEILSGDNLKGVLGRDTLEGHLDIKQLCANIGLKPVRITEHDQFIDLIALLLDQN